MKKNNQPLISVVMPVYNAGEFLAEAIESILSQTYKNFEFIIIDDASTDNSLQILKKHQRADKRIKILNNNTKMGIGRSLNKALKIAKGEFIARMDADDISLPNRFTTQINLLNKNKKIVACGGQAVIISNKGKFLAYKKFPTKSETLYKMIMTLIPLQHPILMARAKFLKKYRYNEKVKTAEDVDMLFYLLSKGKLSNVDDVVYKYRKSSNSNGYHSVRETFDITFVSRLRAIKKYGYKPTLFGLVSTFVQYAIIHLLPPRIAVSIFEAVRFEPTFWRKILPKFLQLAIQ